VIFHYKKAGFTCFFLRLIICVYICIHIIIFQFMPSSHDFKKDKRNNSIKININIPSEFLSIYNECLDIYNEINFFNLNNEYQ
ncbi:MAG: hypothetical protein CFH13_00642, partial [Alphaproteobacteria bacterium MarineAlpha5_Bin3]